MIVITPKDEIPKSINKSIFLAGPTPRQKDVDEKYFWRKEAIKILEKKGYDGTVFSPEFHAKSYEEQVEWENKCLSIADCILFWIPRDLEVLPGFTTNVEYGEWMKSGKIVLGFPETAAKVRYLKEKAMMYKIPMSVTLEETIDNALSFLGDGGLRNDGEIYIPLHIWKHVAFQQWYQKHKVIGNRLDGAKIEWSFPRGRKPFLFIIHANVHIAAEDRNKINEIVIYRSDISTILAYLKPAAIPFADALKRNILDTKIVLTKEFRSPVSNKECFVFELPGGSSFKPGKTSLELAADEFAEETSLRIENYSRFIYHQSRQLLSTLSAHKAHLFSIELTPEELEHLESLKGKTFGVEEDTEKTYVEIKTVKEILNDELLDWSMMGMILSILNEEEK